MAALCSECNGWSHACSRCVGKTCRAAAGGGITERLLVAVQSDWGGGGGWLQRERLPETLVLF